MGNRAARQCHPPRNCDGGVHVNEAYKERFWPKVHVFDQVLVKATSHPFFGYDTDMIIWSDLLNVWMIAFVVVGAVLLWRKPMVSYGFPRPLELSLATSCFLIYFFHFSAVVVVPFLDAQNMAGQPCTSGMPEIQCYNLSTSTCESAWDHFSKDCDREVRQGLDPKNLSALVGPSVKKCIYKKIDRSFRSTRRMAAEDTPACKDFFAAMDAPAVD